MTEAMRALVRAGECAGTLSGDGVASGRAEHPVCGDTLEFDVRFAGERVAEVAWRAEGCPATLSVAAVAAEAWRGVCVDEAPARLATRLAELGGLARHERHAERAALRAFDAACAAARR